MLALTIFIVNDFSMLFLANLQSRSRAATNSRIVRKRQHHCKNNELVELSVLRYKEQEVFTFVETLMPHAHGCKHTILYSKQDFVAEVSRISGGEKLPVVFDSVGKDTFLRSLDCLRPLGLMVTFGQASGPIDPIAPVLLSQKGSLFLTRPLLFHYIARREELEASASELFNVVASGKVRINVNQRFSLKDAADAHKALEARATSGSTILTI
jgi:NADPH2:quinone reductase